MRFKKSKLLRYLATVFFTVGTIASIGFLGCSGVFLICASIPLAVTVFLLSGAIEETVYGESIYKGLGRLKLIGPKADQFFLKIELNNYLENYLKKAGSEKFKASENNFLKDYYEQRKYYKNLKKNSSADKKALKEAKKRLKDLQNFFFRKTIEGNLNKVDKNYITSDLAQQSSIMLKRAKSRAWLLTILFGICVVVGTGAGLVTASAMSATLPSLGIVLSLGALSAVVWPVAGLAMIGAIFLLYKNMTDFFKENTLEKVKELYKNVVRSRAKSMLGLIIVSLTLFTAVATACTWWVAVKTGFTLIPGVPLILVAICCPILVGFNFATDLSYGVGTTSKTVRTILAIRISKLLSRLKKNFNDLRKIESLGQLLNPFRIIIKLINIPFKVLIFFGHVVSMGITTDRLGTLPPILVAVGCSIPEALQDASFFVEEGHSLCDYDDGHDHGGIVMSMLVWTKNIILILLLVPIFSGIWHWFFRKEGSNLNLWNSIFYSIKQTCDIHKHKHPETSTESTPLLSKAWREVHRPAFILSEARMRLSSAKIDVELAKEKRAYINNLMLERKNIVNYLTQEADEEKSTPDALEFYLKKNPKTEEQTILNDSVNNEALSSKVPIAKDYMNKETKNIQGMESTGSQNESVANKCLSYATILNKRRTYSSCVFFGSAFRNTSTKTSKLVQEAFSLVVPASG